jgi:hypothetical protein
METPAVNKTPRALSRFVLVNRDDLKVFASDFQQEALLDLAG